MPLRDLEINPNLQGNYMIQADGENTVAAYSGNGWTVVGVIAKFFVPTKKKTKTGKPLKVMILHRFIELKRDEANVVPIRFSLGRSGIWKDSREQGCAIKPEGHSPSGLIQNIAKLTGSLLHADSVVHAVGS